MAVSLVWYTSYHGQSMSNLVLIRQLDYEIILFTPFWGSIGKNVPIAPKTIQTTQKWNVNQICCTKGWSNCGAAIYPQLGKYMYPNKSTVHLHRADRHCDDIFSFQIWSKSIRTFFRYSISHEISHVTLTFDKKFSQGQTYNCKSTHKLHHTSYRTHTISDNRCANCLHIWQK